jgi:hypothetical protein
LIFITREQQSDVSSVPSENHSGTRAPLPSRTGRALSEFDRPRQSVPHFSFKLNVADFDLGSLQRGASIAPIAYRSTQQ